MPEKQRSLDSTTDLDESPADALPPYPYREDALAAKKRASGDEQQRMGNQSTFWARFLYLLQNSLRLNWLSDAKNEMMRRASLPPRVSVPERLRRNMQADKHPAPPSGESPLEYLYHKTYAVHQTLCNLQPGKLTLSFLELLRSELDLVIEGLAPLSASDAWDAKTILHSLAVARNKLGLAMMLFDVKEIALLHRVIIRNKVCLRVRDMLEDVLMHWYLLVDHETLVNEYIR